MYTYSRVRIHVFTVSNTPSISLSSFCYCYAKNVCRLYTCRLYMCIIICTFDQCHTTDSTYHNTSKCIVHLRYNVKCTMQDLPQRNVYMFMCS